MFFAGYPLFRKTITKSRRKVLSTVQRLQSHGLYVWCGREEVVIQSAHSSDEQIPTTVIENGKELLETV